MFEWLTKRSPNLSLVSSSDSIFVVERIFDMFKFKGDQDSIGKNIPKLPHIINSNASLLITSANIILLLIGNGVLFISSLERI